ncbi:MAG: galactokinase [Lachnospiraceae bacterium]|nr:galactokinase [Lachnospiraceae bacterium]
MAVNVAELREQFETLFGSGGKVKAYFAPGRVNLIGEHTDYNGGHVFPCALTIGTYGIIRPRSDRRLRLYSVNFSDMGIVESSLDDLVPSDEAGWTNYPKGIMWTFEKRGYHLTSGADLLFYGDIPAGSGLSSSASLEVLTGLMLRDTFGFEISMVDLALIGQYSENNFNGMNCGIMDQFASAMGRKDCAIFLDTSNLNYEYAPVRLPDARIVITNSNVKHSLVSSAYNDRRNESEAALKALKTVVDIETLGDLTEAQFEQYKDAIKDPVCQKRAKHAVYENQRTIHAVEALKRNDIATFGKLINDSHVSLRDDYETSCEETDILAELAWNVPGVLGSRITGGGFGGCTVSIVNKDSVDLFIKTLDKAYKEKTGIEAEFYVVDIGDGAHRLED